MLKSCILEEAKGYFDSIDEAKSEAIRLIKSSNADESYYCIHKVSRVPFTSYCTLSKPCWGCTSNGMC